MPSNIRPLFSFPRSCVGITAYNIAVIDEAAAQPGLFFLVPTLLRGNAYITLTVSCSHAGAWEQGEVNLSPSNIRPLEKLPGRFTDYIAVIDEAAAQPDLFFLVPTLLRGNAYITLTVSCSHAGAWEQGEVNLSPSNIRPLKKLPGRFADNIAVIDEAAAQPGLFHPG